MIEQSGRCKLLIHLTRCLHSNTVVQSHGFARKPSAVPDGLFWVRFAVAPVRLRALTRALSFYATAPEEQDASCSSESCDLRRTYPRIIKNLLSLRPVSIVGAILISISAIAILHARQIYLLQVQAKLKLLETLILSLVREGEQTFGQAHQATPSNGQ